MKRRTVSLSLSTGALAAFALVILSGSLGAGEPSPPQVSVWDDAIDQYEATALANQSKLLSVGEHGLEPGAAGFHLLPPRNADAPHKNLASGPIALVFGGRPFWFVKTRDPDSYAGPFGISQSIAWLSVDRIWDNDSVELLKFIDGTTWSISMTFTAEGQTEVIDYYGESSEPVDYVDWFGQLRSANEVASEMRVALVVRGLALMPISISDMIASSGPYTATVATELTEAEADYIIALYASS